MAADTIARRLKRIAKEVEQNERSSPVTAIRSLCVRESGRLTEDGRDLLDWARNRKISQRAIASLLGITDSAVSNYYNR